MPARKQSHTKHHGSTSAGADGKGHAAAKGGGGKPSAAGSAAVPDVRIMAGGILFTVLAILWWITAEDAHVVDLRRNFEVSDVTTNRISFTHDAVTGSHIWARGALNPSSVASMPVSAIVELNTIRNTPLGAALLLNNGSLPMRFLVAGGFKGQASYGGLSVLTISFYLAVENRKGADSTLSGMFAFLPAETHMHGIIYWTDAEIECAPKSISGEINGLKSVVEAIVETSKELCTDRIELCGGAGHPRALSIAEAKYAVATYLLTVYRDQAIIPVLSLARVHNGQPGLEPRLNEETHRLEVMLTRSVSSGEELTVQLNKGVSGQLTARGVFDENAKMVEMPLNLARYSKAVDEACGVTQQDTGLGADGRPMPGLLFCLQILTAEDSEELRMRIARNPRKYTTPDALRNVYGNISGGIEQIMMLDEKEQREAQHVSECDYLPAPVGPALIKFKAFKKKTLEANLAFTKAEYKRYAEMTGVAPSFVTEDRLEQLRAEAAAAAAAQDAAGKGAGHDGHRFATPGAAVAEPEAPETP